MLLFYVSGFTGHYPKLVLHFALRRNVLFFILETYVPSILLVVLSWVSFWISQSSVPARTCIGQYGSNTFTMGFISIIGTLAYTLRLYCNFLLAGYKTSKFDTATLEFTVNILFEIFI